MLLCFCAYFQVLKEADDLHRHSIVPYTPEPSMSYVKESSTIEYKGADDGVLVPRITMSHILNIDGNNFCFRVVLF
jgi:hypothetical protein